MTFGSSGEEQSVVDPVGEKEGSSNSLFIISLLSRMPLRIPVGII